MTETNPFDQLVDEQFHAFLQLKRLYALQKGLLAACSGRTIQNDLIYNQLLFTSIEGMVLRLDLFGERLVDMLRKLQGQHGHRFARKNKTGLAVNPDRISGFGDSDPNGQIKVARILTKKHYEQFDAQYDEIFPGVKVRAAGKPNHTDFELLIERFRAVFQPVRNHRDTVVAHRDKNPLPATLAELDRAMDHTEDLLSKLLSIARLQSTIFELGGMAAPIKPTISKLATLILGKFRTRKANPEDMNLIYMMGFDAWGKRMPEKEYLTECENSEKYQKGTWFVLENGKEEVISSLIIYDLQVAGHSAVGIGSVATTIHLRKNGHAGQLLWDVISHFHDRSGKKLFFLWADAQTNLYANCNFVPMSKKFQTRENSTLMVRCNQETLEAIQSDAAFKPPSYF